MVTNTPALFCPPDLGPLVRSVKNTTGEAPQLAVALRSATHAISKFLILQSCPAQPGCGKASPYHWVHYRPEQHIDVWDAQGIIDYRPKITADGLRYRPAAEQRITQFPMDIPQSLQVLETRSRARLIVFGDEAQLPLQQTVQVRGHGRRRQPVISQHLVDECNSGVQGYAKPQIAVLGRLHGFVEPARALQAALSEHDRGANDMRAPRVNIVRDLSGHVFGIDF